MKTNSTANIAPASKPALSVPSRAKSGMPRSRAQVMTSAVAMIERIAACAISDTSPAMTLIVTCWNPHSAVRSTISAYALASRGLRSTAAILAYYRFMARPKKPPVSREEEAPAGLILERPDGFYWQEKEGRGGYRPFPTRAD